MTTDDPGAPGDKTADDVADGLLGIYHDRNFSNLPDLEGSTGIDPPTGQHPGDRIGRYKLLQLIAEGGMGEVWMAEQRDPVQRKVALKIIKVGMATREVIARFEAERNALALMDHPHIAHIYDGGATEQGRPYFVMELVQGVPITDYCDKAKLDTRARLALFITVCEAVQHAHQRGIIHRDLKPGNILVANHDGKPFPKVIDFGIAKATSQRLTERTLFTEYGRIVGTFAYMAPEQAEFSVEDVDTRADLYSLGCLLYELLTGAPPFEEAELRKLAFDQVCQTIRESEPAKPSARLSTLGEEKLTAVAERHDTGPRRLRKAIRGELDWVVMKALEKDRNRRYQTAAAFGQDLQHHLHDQAVDAGPPSTAYRFGKFARRHRALINTIVAVFIFLLFATGYVVRQNFRLSEAQTDTLQALDAARTNLRNSLQEQARSTRMAKEPGRRHRSLALVEEASAIRSSPRLRDEAIAAFALPDVRRESRIEVTIPKGAVTAMDREGRLYAIGTVDGIIEIHNTEDWRTVTNPFKPGGRIRSLQFSSNSRNLAAVHERPTGPSAASVWDLQSGHPVMEVDDVAPGSVQFADRKSLLAIGHRGQRKIVVYDLDSKTVKWTLSTSFPPGRFRLDPSARMVAVTAHPWARTGQVHIYNLETGAKEITLDHPSEPIIVAWHPRKNMLASSDYTNTIYVWDLHTRSIVQTMHGHVFQVNRLQFHPSGDFLCSCGGGNVTHIWDPHRGESLLRLRGAFEKFLNGGNRLEVSPQFLNGGIWSFSGAASCYSHFHQRAMPGKFRRSLSFSPDSRWLAGTTEEVLSLWDLETEQEVGSYDIRKVREILFEAGGETILAGGPLGLRRLRLRFPGSTGPVEILDDLQLTDREISRFALSPDGATIACFLHKIYLLDARSGTEKDVLTGQRGIKQVRFDPTGRWLAAGNFHGDGVRLWDLEAPRKPHLNLLPGQSNVNAKFSPDGRLGTIRAHEFALWIPGEETPRRRIGTAEEGRAFSGAFAFHPRESLVALSLGYNDVKLLDFRTWRYVATLRPRSPARVHVLRFSPDGRYLAAACTSGAVFVWNLPQLRASLDQIGLEWD